MELKTIGYIRTDFKEKFGIPRQSGLARGMIGRIVLLPAFARREALRGIGGYSHLWLLWGFSEAEREKWAPTVRPPRLGGNRRVGVFATRSPYRPNPIGLSSVRFLGIEEGADGPVLLVEGADLLDGTPIYDIKPYLAYTDSHPDAVCGFSDDVRDYRIAVDFPKDLLARVPREKRDCLLSLLEGDPRPGYQKDGARDYGFCFADLDVHFSVRDGVLSVTDVRRADGKTNEEKAGN